MNAITLRNIPHDVQRAIRDKARSKRISVNKAVIELLEERVGVLRTRGNKIYDDLDDLAGSWAAREAKEFDQTIDAARQIDESLWR